MSEFVKQFKEFKKKDHNIKEITKNNEIFDESVVITLFRYEGEKSKIIDPHATKLEGSHNAKITNIAKVLLVGSSVRRNMKPGDIVTIKANMVYGRTMNPDYLNWLSTAQSNLQQVSPPEGIKMYKSNLEKLLEYTFPVDPIQLPEQLTLEDILTIKIPETYVWSKYKG